MLVQYSTPALIYTIPSFHNPTGWTLSLPRRRRLLELVRGQSMVQVQGMQIVEDDSYALTRFEGEAEHALFDLSGKTTIYLSSFSTTIAPGPPRRLAHPPRDARRGHRRGRGRRVHHAVAAEPGDGVRVHHARQLRAASRRAARRAPARAATRCSPRSRGHLPDGEVVASRRRLLRLGGAARDSPTAVPCWRAPTASRRWRARRSARCRARSGCRTAPRRRTRSTPASSASPPRSRSRRAGALRLVSAASIAAARHPGLQSRCRNPGATTEIASETSRPQDHRRHRRSRRSAGAGARQLAGRGLVDDPRVLRRRRPPDVHLPRRDAGLGDDPARHLPGDLRQPRRRRPRRRPCVPSLRAGAQLRSRRPPWCRARST